MQAFHGTAALFDAFDYASRGSSTGYDGAEMATFLAACPRAAGHYAEVSALVLAEQNEREEDEDCHVEIAPRVLRVEISDDLELLVLDGEEDEDSDLYGLIENDRKALAYARAHGYDGVRWPHGSVSNEGDTIALLNPADAAIVGVWAPAARMAA